MVIFRSFRALKSPRMRGGCDWPVRCSQCLRLGMLFGWWSQVLERSLCCVFFFLSRNYLKENVRSSFLVFCFLARVGSVTNFLSWVTCDSASQKGSYFKNHKHKASWLGKPGFKEESLLHFFPLKNLLATWSILVLLTPKQPGWHSPHHLLQIRIFFAWARQAVRVQ